MLSLVFMVVVVIAYILSHLVLCEYIQNFELNSYFSIRFETSTII